MYVLLVQLLPCQRLQEQPRLRSIVVREPLRHGTLVQRSGAPRHGRLHAAGGATLPLQRHAKPDVLDVTPTHPRALSFGTGPHVCLSPSLLQLETITVLETLLRRRPGLQLCGMARQTLGALYRGFALLPVSG